MYGRSKEHLAGRREIIDLLRQRSRPYLFSNSVVPAIAGATIEVLKILEESAELRDRLMANCPATPGSARTLPTPRGDLRPEGDRQRRRA